MTQEIRAKLIDRLSKINQLSFSLYGKEIIIVRDEGYYLSGLPYLWSILKERAFVFANREQAQKVIDDFSLPAKVHVCQE